VLLTLCVLFLAGVGTAAASGLGKPESPPGQGACEHGNSGKPCRDDPQPEHGRECEHHGNLGGVNEDHCGGAAAPEPPPTTVAPPPPPTTTTTTVVTTPSAPVNPQAPVTPAQTSPPSTTPKQEPKHEEPKEERAPSSTPPKATSAKTDDAPKQPAKQATPEPKQDVKAAVAPAAEKKEAVDGCAPPRVLAVAPETAGQLPFTGLPLWVYVLGGLTALVAGLGLRRLARARRVSAQ
jgi:hypothetical protein